MPPSPFRLTPLTFSDLDGWAADDHAAALAAFRVSAAAIADAPPKSRALGFDGAALSTVARNALALPDASAVAARAFFEARFAPVLVEPETGAGFFTGYYEPELDGARAPSARFSVPLHAPPADLVEIDETDPPAGIPAGYRFARRTESGYAPYPDRAAIMAGALDGAAPALVHLADPVDAFFVHVQGAARIRLAEGGVMRVTYAAKTGHPYTPIGRVLIERGALAPGGVTMQAIRAWLAGHPDEAPSVLAANRSYIFFREAPVDDPALGPVAAARVPLSAGRSLAVDRTLHTFHMPVWIETALPGGAPLRRLLVAQDTGSAILGPARGDVFFGSGDAAGALAGAMQAAGRFVVLVPREALP